MMGSPGDGGDTFTTLVSLLADPRQYTDKLRALEKSKKDANLAWQQATDAIKKSEAVRAEAEKAQARLEATKAEISRREGALSDSSIAMTNRATELSNIEAKLRRDRNDFEATRKTGQDAHDRKAQELAERDAALKKAAAEADAEAKRARADFEREKATHLRTVETERAAAQAARKQAEAARDAAEKLRAEHETRLSRLVALAQGK